MIKFNPKNKSVLTVGESLEPAMEITDKANAIQYKKDYINYIYNNSDNPISMVEAEKIADSNLGYYSGYYSNDVRKRVEELFNSFHPEFGTMDNETNPKTPMDAFLMGYEMGSSR